MRALASEWVESSVAELMQDSLFTDGDWIETKDQDPNGGIRLVQLADVGEGEFRDRSSRFVNSETAARLNCTFLSPGDVLVARMPEPLGRACLVPDLGMQAITAVDVCVLRPKGGLDASWLMWAINSPQVRRQVLALQTGTTRKRISRRNLGTVQLSVPPLDEQQRVVAAIEEQFSRLDAAHDLLARGRKGLRRLEAAISATLLDRENWPTHPLRDFLTEPLRNGHSAKATAAGQEGIRTLTLTAVTARDFSEANTKVTVAAPDKVKDLWLRPGDILIERSNTADLVGSAAIYEGEEDWAIFPDLMIRVRVGGALLPGFLDLVLRTPEARRYFRARAQGISGSMPKISQPIVEALPIPVPPRPAQEEALSEEQRLSSIVSSLRGALTTAERRAAGLRGTILRDAFAGRLFPCSHDTETSQPEKVTA